MRAKRSGWTEDKLPKRNCIFKLVRGVAKECSWQVPFPWKNYSIHWFPTRGAVFFYKFVKRIEVCFEFHKNYWAIGVMPCLGSHLRHSRRSRRSLKMVPNNIQCVRWIVNAYLRARKLEINKSSSVLASGGASNAWYTQIYRSSAIDVTSSPALRSLPTTVLDMYSILWYSDNWAMRVMKPGHRAED